MIVKKGNQLCRMMMKWYCRGDKSRGRERDERELPNNRLYTKPKITKPQSTTLQRKHLPSIQSALQI